MARFEWDGVRACASGLEQMGRPQIRRIVEAGADAAIARMKDRMDETHRRFGDMSDSVDRGEYRETLGGGSQAVYPHGEDRKGVSNALKAFVINYGRGGTRKKGKMGDRFIDRDPDMEDIVRNAMQRESDRIMDELSR